MMKKKTKLPLPLRIIRWSFPKVEKLMPSVAGAWAWKLFFTPFRYKPPVPEVEIIEKAKQFKFVVSGITIQGYEWGSGEKTILLLHGWSGRASQFRKFIEPLNKRGFKVIGIDGPSHGRSSGSRTHLMEFVEVLMELKGIYPELESIIAHSFGGAASMMAVREGLTIKRLVNIGSPTDADYIISDFLRRINGSSKSGERFKQKVIDMFDKPFSYFSIKESIRHVEDLELFMIHDKNDKEVPFKHAVDVHNASSNAKLMLTEGLGHMRILKDRNVIAHCLDFVDGEVKQNAKPQLMKA